MIALRDPGQGGRRAADPARRAATDPNADADARMKSLRRRPVRPREPVLAPHAHGAVHAGHDVRGGAVIAMLSIGAGAEQRALAMIERLGVHNVLVRGEGGAALGAGRGAQEVDGPLAARRRRHRRGGAARRAGRAQGARRRLQGHRRRAEGPGQGLGRLAPPPRGRAARPRPRAASSTRPTSAATPRSASSAPACAAISSSPGRRWAASSRSTTSG